VTQGKALYDQHCTACHGANGGAGDRAPAIVSTATSMRGQRSDAQLMAIVKNGIPGSAMPAWNNRLSDGDIANIGAFIHAMRGTALDNPLPGDVARGEAVFWGKGQCATCHAISGRGSVIGPDLGNIAGTAQIHRHQRRPDQGRASRLWRWRRASAHPAADGLMSRSGGDQGGTDD
jgi:mono/diheme cytochrome c family protein